ncbi:MAG: hypothetical protein A2Z16_06605 [Chloroflexi bacterium RBG_16_54_18]|nr:MAG: hypothetical protein A2Z16_06605 [Chloroflexi bacterium RBG_16_54_18]
MPPPNQEFPASLFQYAFDFAQSQVRHLIQSHPDFFPVYTAGGRWKHGGEAWTNWCEGFLGGMLWIFHLRTGDLWWREQAEHYSRLIEHRQHDRTVHDLGFLFWSTWKRWYDLTGDPAVNQVVISAGKTLSLRFKENGAYLRSFMADDSLFIDIMMNVGIIFYAAQQTGDAQLLEIAHRHCRTTRKYMVRGDGGTAHEGIFNLDSGEFLRQSTQQGWRGDSTWARGLAWAIYGFSHVYQLTGALEYLETARLCAGYYLLHTGFSLGSPAGAGIPPNDYDDPRQPVPYDSSAAAIAAGGFLNLSEAVQDIIYAAAYRQAAFAILETLCEPHYLASDTPGWEGILKHGIYHQVKSLGVDESVMWGDYFFVEALDRVMTGSEVQ